jgi:hypothetical protein
MFLAGSVFLLWTEEERSGGCIVHSTRNPGCHVGQEDRNGKPLVSGLSTSQWHSVSSKDLRPLLRDRGGSQTFPSNSRTTKVSN